MSGAEFDITRADVERWSNERRATEPPRVTFGAWEPIYGPERTRQVATRTVGALFPTVIEWTEIKDEPITGYRRRRFERWYDAEGRELGRWTWQYADTSLAAVESLNVRKAR